MRASRALALRFLARLWGNDLESVTVVALVPSTRGEEAKAMTVSSHTNDLADLLAGMQRVSAGPCPHGTDSLEGIQPSLLMAHQASDVA